VRRAPNCIITCSYRYQTRPGLSETTCVGPRIERERETHSGEKVYLRFLHDDSLVFLLEPGHRVSLGHSVAFANFGWLAFTAGNTVTRSDQNDVEIHTEDTGGWVILQTKIDVLTDTESESAGVGKVVLLQLILLDFKSTI
jgi:hypothetical protein